MMTADVVADFRRKVGMTRAILIAWAYLNIRLGNVSRISNVIKRMCDIRLDRVQRAYKAVSP